MMSSTKGGVFQTWNDGSTTKVAEAVVQSKSMTKPATTRRTKPADLFVGSTARRIYSSEVDYTYGTQKDHVGAKRIFAPFSYWGALGNVSTLVKPSGDADFKDIDNMVRLAIKDQNVNLMQALAESKQTASLFLGTARDIISTFHSLRSGRPLRDFVKILRNPKTRNGRNLANRWLELQFGWKPLLSDVYGSAQALAKELQTGKYLYAVKTVTEKQAIRSKYVLGDRYCIASLRRKVHARYKVSCPKLKTLAEIGITNPLAVAWEVVPWSFVIDWMIPVGDYLQGLDALSGVSDLKVIRSFRYHSQTSSALEYSDATSRLTGARGILTEQETRRFAVDSNLSFGNLRWEPSVTRNRILNSLALLRQMKR